MIVPRYYEDLEILHDNTMPARAYYIPASKKMDDLIEHRETSDRFQLLDKNWKFQYFESIYDVKDRFFETGYDTSGFEDLDVLHAWQLFGHDVPQYTNIRYPFPFDPPYVPQDILWDIWRIKRKWITDIGILWYIMSEQLPGM